MPLLGSVGDQTGLFHHGRIPITWALSLILQLLATIFTAVFTGAVIAFLDRFQNSTALGAYPVGLRKCWCKSHKVSRYTSEVTGVGAYR